MPRVAGESSILSPMFLRPGYAALAVFLVVSGCGSSDSRKADIRIQGRPGDKYTVEISSKTTYNIPDTETTPAAQEQISVTEVLSYKCLKLQDDKSTWSVTTDKIEATGSGSMTGQAHALQESKKGKTPSFTRDAQNKSSDQSVSNALDPLFPNRPVSVGDQWRGEANMQGVSVLMTHTFEGFASVDGREAFLISSKSDSPSINVLKPIKIWIETSTGWPIKGEGEFEVVSNEGFKSTTAMTLRRK